MKLIQTLFESNEDRIISKAKHVYKAFKKGRGKVKMTERHEPLDVYYELPGIDKCLIKIKPAWGDENNLMAFITMFEPVKFKILNAEDLDIYYPNIPKKHLEEYIIKQFIDSIGYMYRRRFEEFDITIKEN
jgi:hypothetical protein